MSKLSTLEYLMGDVLVCLTDWSIDQKKVWKMYEKLLKEETIKDKTMVYQYICPECKHVFKKLVRNRKLIKAFCPECQELACRVIKAGKET